MAIEDLPMARYIRSHFSNRPVGDRSMFADVDRTIQGKLSDTGYRGLAPSMGIDSDPFSHPMSSLPRDTRVELLAERAKAYGLGQIPSSKGKAQSFGMRIIEGEDGRPYGGFAVPRASFLGETDQASRIGYMNLGLSNLQIDGDSVSLSGSAYTERFLRSQVSHIDKMKDPSFLDSKKVFYFDTETTGVHQGSRPWQIVGRMEVAGKLDESLSVDLNFKGLMDSLWPGADNKPVQFEEFYDNLRKGNINWSTDLQEGLKHFLRNVNQADYVVAHNAAFDIQQVMKSMNDLYRFGDDEFKELADTFTGKFANPDNVIDTRAMASVLTGEVAPGMKGKRFSIENLLINTSALDDIQSRYGIDLASRIREGGGLHDAAVDTDVLRYMARLMGDAAAGEDVLRNTGLIDDGLIEAIQHGSAMTPLTKLDDLDVTPLQYSIDATRRFGNSGIDAGEVTVGRLFSNAGIYTQWSKDAAAGRIFDSGYESIQARAIAENMPFAGLSAPERLLSTQIATNMDYRSGEMAGVRSAIGELTGTGVFRAAEKVQLYGGQNLAVNLDTLRSDQMLAFLDEMGQSGLARSLSVGPQMAEDVVEGRLSFYQWRDHLGRSKKDAALVVDIFRSFEEGGIDDMNRFIDILEEQGVDRNVIKDLRAQLKRDPENILKRGIQIANLGSGDKTDAIYDTAERLGATVDSKSAHVARVALDRVVSADGAEFVTTSPTLIGGRAGSPVGTISGLDKGVIVTERLKAKALNEALDQQSGRRGLNYALRMAINSKSSDSGKILRTFEHIEKIKGKSKVIAGAAALIFGGGAFVKRRQDMATYDQTIDFQGYEDGGYYDEYRRSMGLSQLAAGYESRHAEVISTMGMVQELDRNKIGHSNMAPNKNSHLFE